VRMQAISANTSLWIVDAFHFEVPKGDRVWPGRIQLEPQLLADVSGQQWTCREWATAWQIRGHFKAKRSRAYHGGGLWDC
jgi:hypothetical protein